MMIEIWERVRFHGQEAVSWERSFDGGENWENVPWPGDRLPFTRLWRGDAEDFETVTVQRIP